MRNIEIAVGECYHIYNRGVDKQNLFKKRSDFERFAMLLYYGNQLDSLPLNFNRLCATLSVQQRGSDNLVKIGSYSIMPNHFHLKILQVQEGGIQKFMHRIQMGYAKYFNLQYERKGCLFEGAYNGVYVRNQAHWEHMDNYIHLNALDLYMPNWRQGLQGEWEKAQMFLETYPWSSYADFVGYNPIIPIVDHEYVLERAPNPKAYIQELKDWAGRHIASFDISGMDDDI